MAQTSALKSSPRRNRRDLVRGLYPFRDGTGANLKFSAFAFFALYDCHVPSPFHETSLFFYFFSTGFFSAGRISAGLAWETGLEKISRKKIV